VDVGSLTDPADRRAEVTRQVRAYKNAEAEVLVASDKTSAYYRAHPELA
jgi:hypothetical protein